MNSNPVTNFLDVLSHLVKGSMELMARPQIQITDLDEQSFHHILEYLPVVDLFLSRRVNKYFLKQIDSYLESCRHLTYGCKLNGVQMSNGEYLFNGRAFDTIISRMPNIRVMKFKKCSKICNALATTNYDLMHSLTHRIIMLYELHITRCRALDIPSLQLLVEWFPNLTHLTITVYNERSVEIIIKGLANLKYFNLDDSCLDDYGKHLRHLGLKIQSFIAAPDHNNHKHSIIDGLLTGNGRYIQELELRIKVFDSDKHLFDKIGEEFSELSNLKVISNSRRTFADNHLLMGLSKLSNLKELHLEELPIHQKFYSIFDDNSMLSILRGAPLMESLTLITGCKSQQTIDVSNQMRLTDDSLSLIDQLLPNLKALSLKSVDITDRTLDSIERLRKLKSLRLDSLSSVSSYGLQNFMTNTQEINRLEVINSLNNHN